jgi:predicted ATPase
MDDMTNKPSLYALTGCSSSGKSTLLEALAQRGVACVREAGRIVVQEEHASGGDGLPWVDPLLFRDLIFEKSTAAFNTHKDHVGPVVFDRSFIEAVSCSIGCGVEPPEKHLEAARELRFNTTVFVTLPWEEIFTTDAERKSTFEDAKAEFELTSGLYKQFGYTLLEVPKGHIDERVDFVMAAIEAGK